MSIALQRALENYRKERSRIVGGAHPHVGCSCGFCDVVRAADLLWQRVMDEHEAPLWQPSTVWRSPSSN